MQTEKIYKLNGHMLKVQFNEKLIRIKAPATLRKFLSTNIDLHSTLLVNCIKNDYFLLYKSDLKINNASLIIEIWGHVFASYLAKAIKSIIKLKLIENFADFIINRSDTIDCGESEVDSNRKFWNLLANFKGIIITFLPKRMK